LAFEIYQTIYKIDDYDAFLLLVSSALASVTSTNETDIDRKIASFEVDDDSNDEEADESKKQFEIYSAIFEEIGLKQRGE
jgi:hypothetical protein